MEQRKLKLLEKQAQIIKAVSHPVRIAVIEYLKDGPQCVCDIAEFTGSERSNISKHLSVMVNAGIISYEKQGLKVIYSISTPCVVDFLGCIEKCLKQQLCQNKEILESFQVEI